MSGNDSFGKLTVALELDGPSSTIPGVTVMKGPLRLCAAAAPEAMACPAPVGFEL